MPIYAAIRAKRLSRQALGHAEAHGRRRDLVPRPDETQEEKEQRERRAERIRQDVNPSAAPSFGWALGQSDHLSISHAYELHLRQSGARPWGKAAPVLHMLAITSPEWVDASGDPYDKNNPRVAALTREVKAWANAKLGGVFAIRYDVDEYSRGVVDIFCSPVRVIRNRPRVSPNEALKELQHETRCRRSFEALHTSWASWAQQHLDSCFERGLPKVVTGAEHIHQDALRELHVAEERVAAREAASAKRENRQAMQERRQAEENRLRTESLDAREAAAANLRHETLEFLDQFDLRMKELQRDNQEFLERVAELHEELPADLATQVARELGTRPKRKFSRLTTMQTNF